MNSRALLLSLALAVPISSAVAQSSPSPAAGAMGAGAMLPTTAEGHAAMASSYEQKAAEWRKEAAFHREMAAAYKASHPDPKGGARNAEAVKMEKHCMAIVKDAEKLASDATWSAKYHHERAKELQAK